MKNRYGILKIIRFHCLLSVLVLGLITVIGTGGGGDGDDNSTPVSLPVAPTQLFALDIPVIIGGIGVSGAEGYRLYGSDDGISWVEEPETAIIKTNDPNFYPSRVFSFSTDNSNTDRYYMVRAYNSAGESANSPTVFAQVESNFTSDVFSINSPMDSETGVSRTPTLAWDPVGNLTAYFVHIEYGSTESWDYVVSTNYHDFGTTTDLICGKYGPLLPANSTLIMNVTAIGFDGWGNRQSNTISFTTGS